MAAVTNNPIFNDETAARAHLEALRWPNGPVCPHCGAHGEDVSAVQKTDKRRKPAPEGKRYKPARVGRYYCKSCTETFTITVGTVMEDSHVPIHKWLYAFRQLCSSKKGMSAHQLHRSMGVSYKTAWFMAHRIREAMRSGGLAPPMGGAGGVVEVDETFIGTKAGATKKHSYHHKRAILTLVDRKGEARSFHIEKASAADIIPIVRKNVDKESTVATDEAFYYGHLNVGFARHGTVNHSADEYVRGDIHTNTVEGFFSVFKRGMRGTYQHCSEKHLHRYLAEFDFRYSNRIKLGVDDTERTERAIRGSVGKRLTYRRTNGA